jgi:hypothetical protein
VTLYLHLHLHVLVGVVSWFLQRRGVCYLLNLFLSRDECIHCEYGGIFYSANA